MLPSCRFILIFLRRLSVSEYRLAPCWESKTGSLKYRKKRLNDSEANIGNRVLRNTVWETAVLCGWNQSWDSDSLCNYSCETMNFCVSTKTSVRDRGRQRPYCHNFEWQIFCDITTSWATRNYTIAAIVWDRGLWLQPQCERLLLLCNVTTTGWRNKNARS
jgi:hypothetical protein